MQIKNVKIFGEDSIFSPGELFIENGKFVAKEQHAGNAMQAVDGEGCYAIPGLIDIHFHGCMGADFSDASPEGLAQIAEYEASQGVTSICPATMTLPEEELHQIMRAARAYAGQEIEEKSFSGQAAGEKTKPANGRRAKLVGINMEGPFISEKKKGAQAAEYIRPCDVELFRKLQKESGNLIKLVDIAPETDGAMSFIEAVKDEVVVSIAHTMADYETAKTAFQKGARHVTHLYNAMPPFGHRDPGVIGAARDGQYCRVELICDEVHIHPSVVRATLAMFGADRVIFISDSLRGTGLTDGKYMLGGQGVTVKGPRATLADGTLAGSVTSLMGCLRTSVLQMGIPLETAIQCATVNPAKAIGIYDTCGSITPGKAADLVLLDKDLQIKAVYVEGMKVV